MATERISSAQELIGEAYLVVECEVQEWGDM
jgi:hypothetical protein